MRRLPQEQFRRRVKTVLVLRNLTVAALAKKIGRHRCNVSSAINSGGHPHVRALIEKEIA